MKKLLLSLLTIIALVACEGPAGPRGADGIMGPEGPQGEPGSGTDWYVTSITINENEWKLVGNEGELNSYYFIEKPLKQLSQYIYTDGAVIAYIETSQGVKNGLPYVLHVGENVNSKEYLWTQTYDFDFRPGYVGFYVTFSDFETINKPGTETFHIVLMW